MSFFNEETYADKDYATTRLKAGEYDSCSFVDCDFSNTHLSKCTFLECTFKDCNFTNAKFGGTTFNEVLFEKFKLLGADFSVCNDFMLQLRFRACLSGRQESALDLSRFVGLKLDNTHFDTCPLKEADFTEAILTGAHFKDCDLYRTTFDQTNLEKADLTTARNFQIDPEKNKIKGAKFSKENISGLLGKYKINIQ